MKKKKKKKNIKSPFVHVSLTILGLSSLYVGNFICGNL